MELNLNLYLREWLHFYRGQLCGHMIQVLSTLYHHGTISAFHAIHSIFLSYSFNFLPTKRAHFYTVTQNILSSNEMLFFFCLTLSSYNEIFIEMKPNKRFLIPQVGKDLSLYIYSEIKRKSSALFHKHLGYTSNTMAKCSWALGLHSLIYSIFNIHMPF